MLLTGDHHLRRRARDLDGQDARPGVLRAAAAARRRASSASSSRSTCSSSSCSTRSPCCRCTCSSASGASSGEVRPQGHLRLGLASGRRRRHQGIRGDEADAVPAARVGVHPGRHPRALRRRRARSTLLVPRRSQQAPALDPTLQSWVFLALLRRLRHPRRHLAVPHLVARRPRLGADRGLDAARRRADEARRLRRRSASAWCCCPRRACTGRRWSARIACINIVYGALSAMAQTDLKYVVAYSSVSHMGVVMLGAATLTEQRAERRRLPDVRARHHDRPLLRAGRPRLREGALARRSSRWAASRAMMPGIAAASRSAASRRSACRRRPVSSPSS